jgi:hypothetical protein
MIQRRVYHVVRRDNDCWQVVREGYHRPHIVRDSKAEAILLAKRLAKAGPDALVIVHGLDNHVERQFTFTTGSL